MADGSGVQVRDLLPSDLQIGQTMKETLSKEQGIGAARLAWGVVGSQAADAIKGVLNVDALQLLGSAWSVAKDLHEYTDRTKHPDGERSVVYLGSHRFKKTVYPQLAVTIEPFKPVTLRFALDLMADIRSVALSILNGRITGTGGGDGALGAQLRYGDIALNKLQLRKVGFPGSFAFKDPGIAIL
ncbi:MAG TPA: hypothetical protein VIW73_10990 [Candidatus Cybelea sp.]